MAVGFDVAGILASISEANRSLQEEGAAVTETSENIITLREEQGRNLEASAKDKELEVLVAQQGELEAQRRNAKGMQMLNVDEIMAQLSPQLMLDFNNLQKMDTEITRKENISFWDNPLDFIQAQTTLDQDLNTRNLTASQLNEKANMMQKVNTLAQSHAQTTAATKQTLSEASIAASARIASLDLRNKAIETSIMAGTVDLERIEKLSKLDDRGIDNLLKQRNLIVSEESLAMQRQEFNASQAERKIRLDEFKKAKTKEGKEEEADIKLLQILNLAAEKLGKRPYQNIEDFKLNTRTAASKATVEKLLDYGYQLMESGESAQIAGTPADAADVLINVNGRLAPTQKRLERLLSETSTAVRSGGVAAGGIDVTNPLLVRERVNAQIGARVKEDTADVMKGEDNIYAPPTVNTIIDAIPAIKNDPFYQKILAPELVGIGLKELDPQYLMSRSAKAVLNKEVTYSQAVRGMRALILGAKEVNNSTMNYKVIGIPEQTTFNTTISAAPNNRWNRVESSADLLDYGQFIKTFTKVVANEVITSKSGGANPYTGNIERAEVERLSSDAVESLSKSRSGLIKPAGGTK